MAKTQSVFDSLTTLFPTAEALLAHLRSPAGGIHAVTETESLALINYDKRFSSIRGDFRSVIWNKVTNRPVSVSPGYGYRFSEAIAKGIGSFTTEEFVDGVMINQFYADGSWQLATRTQLGATGSFFGKRSFATLFEETFASLGLTTDMLTPGVSYSWVLQHPEERVVVAPAYGIPVLKLVQVYGSVGSEHASLNALRPETYKLATLEDVKDFVAAQGRRLGHQFKGVVLRTEDGTRYKLRSTDYEAAHHLRGNQAKRAYTWLERWSTGFLPAYLRLYPEEQCDAEAVIEKFKGLVQEVHDLYQKVYRRKELRLGDAPQKFRKILWEVNQQRKGAYFPLLRDFMNGLETKRKLWLVNYETRYAVQADGKHADKGAEAEAEAEEADA